MERHRTIDERRGFRLLLAAMLVAVLWAAPASAYQVHFTGPGGWGVSATDASAAADAGVPILEPGTLIAPVSEYISVPSRVVQTYTPGTPSLASSLWSIENVQYESSLEDAWLVFSRQYTGAALSYPDASIGLDLVPAEGWGLLSVAGYFYPVVALGTLDALESTDILVRHVVGVALQTNSQGDLVLPQYSLSLAQNLVPVPEPVTGLLSLVGVLALAGMRIRAKAA